MTDPGFNNLLKWGIANSSAANPEADSDAATTPQPTRSSGLDQAALAQLLGGPSDADRMREAMVAIQHPEIDLDNKLIAFDNFEQMIENLDNANNMEPLGLWPPLVEQLENEESELQRMAAWCVGTAVQNNVRSQDKCLAVGGVPKLLKLALDTKVPAATRKKAVFALSSQVRNHQPALDALVAELPPQFRGEDKLDAADMDAVDTIINRLRVATKQSS